jgi:hypothetical protein
MRSAQMKFKKGQDLRLVVFNYYNETVKVDEIPGQNYVDAMGILCRRRECSGWCMSTRSGILMLDVTDEYLGPMPCVAGFQFDGNQGEVQFWDAHLKVAWMGDGSWDVEAEFDPAVEAWFVIT